MNNKCLGMCGLPILMRLDQIQPTTENTHHSICTREDHMPLKTGIIHSQNKRRPALSSSRKISILFRDSFSARHRSSEEILRWPTKVVQSKIKASIQLRCHEIATDLVELMHDIRNVQEPSRHKNVRPLLTYLHASYSRAHCIQNRVNVL